MSYEYVTWLEATVAVQEKLILKLRTILVAVNQAFCDSECGHLGHGLNCRTLQATIKLTEERYDGRV